MNAVAQGKMSDLILRVIKLGRDDKPPLIMLHGWRQSLESLRPLGELLADERHVHLIDLPGFGSSQPPPSGWGTAEYAKRIIRYLDEEKIQRADFLGHSFGGKISMYVAFRMADRLSRLILINASGVRAPLPWKRRLKVAGVRNLRLVLRLLQKYLRIPWYETWFIPRFASADYKAAGFMREVFVRVVNEEFSAEVPAIRAPALLLWGRNDTETPIAAGERVHELIPGSDLVVLEGSDHFPFLGAGASLCAYHVKEFFKRTSGSKEAAVHG